MTMNRAFARMTGAFRGLRRAQSGAVAPLLGLLMLILIGCMGLSIDVGRSMVVKARLVDALDAAGLAVGSRPDTTDYNAEAKKFVTANFRALYAGATVTSVSATPSSDKSTVSLSATATMPTAFMKLFGQPLVTVNATTEITRASTGLELAIVLDNTGSMDVSNSMPALKNAATGLVNQLFASAGSASDNLYISLVPFSQAVNIGTGTDRAAWTDLNTVSRKFYPGTWTGCVEARDNGYDVTDSTSNVLVPDSIFSVYYAEDIDDHIYKGKTLTYRKNDWIKPNGLSTDIKYVDNTTQQGPGAFCPQPLMPLTNNKAALLNSINAMKAAGSTIISEGLVWGWRTISPSWRGRWSGSPSTLPLAYGTKNMNKAVVLMTDGDNSFAEGNYTAYGRLVDKRLTNSASQSAAENKLDDRLTTVCNNMKSAGVMVITVGYGDDITPQTTNLLTSCATNSTLYFAAANSAELISKFAQIAGALSNLRVSK